MRRALSSCSFSNGRDDERLSVTFTRAEVGVQFPCELTFIKGVDHFCCIRVIEGDNTLFVIHKHAHGLSPGIQKLLQCHDTHNSTINQSPPRKQPVAIVWTPFHSLCIDKHRNYSQFPAALLSDLYFIVKPARRHALLCQNRNTCGESLGVVGNLLLFVATLYLFPIVG